MGYGNKIISRERDNQKDFERNFQQFLAINHEEFETKLFKYFILKISKYYFKR